MTKRTEALSAEFHQFLKDNKFLYDRMDEEQFVCYALSAIQKLDAANTPPTEAPSEGADENSDPL